MKSIREVHSEGEDWLETHPFERWTLHQDEGYRYGITTTNMGECLNGLYVGLRAMPISSIVLHTFFRTVTWFIERYQAAYQMLNAGIYIPKKITDDMKPWSERAKWHKVTLFSRRDSRFAVVTGSGPDSSKGGNAQTGILDAKNGIRECTCGKLQGRHLPCSHAYAAARSVNLNPLILVSPYYKTPYVVRV
ncbi:unnamed protein product [Linum trigynum]|uniref:SWIM-type domain-containing protein n=1 Tax=Linum trigynum TaxID=586398 RepID=A0AAV2ELN5_9ROSI